MRTATIHVGESMMTTPSHGSVHGAVRLPGGPFE